MEYSSLYDYLGKPAGEQLGWDVAKEANKHGIPIQTKEISNPKHTGTVNLYPIDFLDFYFTQPDSIHMEDLPGSINYNIDDDDLPF
jgi:hypothetical protein